MTTSIRGRSLLWVGSIVTAIALVATALPPLSGDAADHLDAPGLTSPGGTPTTDINDLYVFEGANSSNTVLAKTVVPVAAGDSTFGADVLYELKVDTDGDFVEDISYELTFSDARANGAQYVVIQKSEGAAAADGTANGALVGYGRVGKSLTVNGGGSLFTGLRSDPFFFDLDAFVNVVEGGNLTSGRQFNDANKSDFFAPLDVLGIVLEVPDSTFGGAINVWSTTSVDGTQIDRIGRPAINTVVNSSGALIGAPSANKNVFNSTEPKDDEQYRPFVLSALKTLSSIDSEGSFTDAQANAYADLLLPDVLSFDKSSTLPAPLNGRSLSDDVISTELNIVTGGDPLDVFGTARDANGAIPTQGLPAHGDYLTAFPYLGAPHATMPAAPVGRTDFVAKLSGSGEVPAVATGARGVATLSATTTALDHLIVAYGLEGITAAHIHIGDADENGPVAVGLFSGDAFTADGRISTGATVGTGLVAGTMSDLFDVMSGGFAYVNVHTTDNPGGEIRGQVSALATAASGSRFTDDNGNVHESAIEILAAAGITKGTSATTYSPFRSITRGEMAAFINRAVNLPPSSVDAFADDNASPFEADINALAAAGITTGTTASTFEPNRSISRGEMAAFLVRGFDLPASSVDAFADDNASPFEADINALAAAGVTKGTSATTYEPTRDVSRAEMASFVARWVGWID
ncbi:MAG: DUF4331 family protein [Acidimicrobiia bacterium]